MSGQGNNVADDLNSLLELYTASSVLEIATFRHIDVKEHKGKVRTIAALAKALADKAQVLAQFEELSAGERVVLDSLLRHGGRLTIGSLRHEAAAQGLVNGPGTLSRDRYGQPLRPNPSAKDPRRLDDALARLGLRGLVFDLPEPTRPNPYGKLRDLEDPFGTVIIPAPIRRHLPQPPALQLPSAKSPVRVDAVAESSARVLQRDLYLFWSYVRDNKVTVTLKDQLHKRALTEIAATLLARETIGKGEGELQHPRLRFIRGLLTAMGAIQELDAERVLRAQPAPGFFARPAAERVAQAYTTWSEEDTFNELIMLPARAGLAEATGAALIPAHRKVIEARLAVIHHIEDTAGEQWQRIDALVDRVRASDYEFLLRRPPPRPAYYYGPTHPYTAYANELQLNFNGVREEEEGWELVEANFIRGIVSGPLYWLGLADLGWEGEQEGAPAAYRLTALGNWLLGEGDQPSIPAEGGRVIVQPNMHVVALDPVADSTLVALDRFAERLSAERAVEYQLTRASVYAGQQAGWDAARIKALLQDLTGVELPANVARTLDEWQAQHERIVIRAHVAIAQGAPARLDECARDARTATLLAARPLPDVALLRDPAAVDTLAAALFEREVLPLVTARSSITPGSALITQDGEIRLTVRAPSLYLHGHLAAIADPSDQGGYRLTRESVARAARGGLSAPQILERLAAIHRGPLPAGLELRVRAWSKHYGDASIEEVTLLQLRDQAVLDELLADPEVAPLIRRFAPPAGRALARVKRSDVERLRALLAERGINLGGKIT